MKNNFTQKELTALVKPSPPSPLGMEYLKATSENKSPRP